jgi:hypothetical protein
MPRKIIGSACIHIDVFLTSALDECEWSTSPSGTQWIRGSVGPRTDLDDVERKKIVTLPRLELRPLRRSACSQSLYWLRYRGSAINAIVLLHRGTFSIETGIHVNLLINRPPRLLTLRTSNTLKHYYFKQRLLSQIKDSLPKWNHS